MTPGYWIILVSDVTKYIYNPMVAGVYYENNESDSKLEIADSEINADDKYFEIEKGKLDKSKKIYAKRTKKPTIKKQIKKTGSDSTPIRDNADTFDFNDKVEFEITTQIPSYSENYYKNVFFKIIDTLEGGLELIQDSIKVEDVTKSDKPVLLEENKDYTFEIKNDKKFKINFEKSYLQNEPSRREIKVTYKARINEEEAKLNFDPNTNTAQIDFPHNPHETEGTIPPEDETTTYHYSFKIDEIKKEDKEGHALGGAEFKLTPLDKENNPVDKKMKFATSETSDKKDYGKVEFKGLAAGNFVLEETKAPKGYSLRNQKYRVEIKINDGDIDEKGILNSYTVKIGECNDEFEFTKPNDVFERTYTKDEEVPEWDKRDETKKFHIKNIKMPMLPSTGGTGTFVFTLVGVALMVIAVVATKKHRQESAN